MIFDKKYFDIIEEPNIKEGDFIIRFDNKILRLKQRYYVIFEDGYIFVDNHIQTTDKMLFTIRFTIVLFVILYFFSFYLRKND